MIRISFVIMFPNGLSTNPSKKGVTKDIITNMVARILLIDSNKRL